MASCVSIDSMDTSADREEGDDSESCVTLVEAIRDKYCSGIEKYYSEETLPAFQFIKEFSTNSKPGALPVEEQSVIIVDNKRISDSGSLEELTAMCPNVKDLFMLNNLLQSWEPIFVILSSMPSLRILNLTLNNFLSRARLVPRPLPLPHTMLSTLHLSCTGVPFQSILSVLSTLPNLSELYLSGNAYKDTDILECQDVQDQPLCQHLQLTLLYLVDNKLTQWSSVEAIGELFPNLITLVLVANPIESISVPEKESKLQSLQTLNLNESLINVWESVENLACCPSLKNLSLLRVPIGNQLNETERRFATIARLPQISYLNKSIISEEERQDAERWLLREYSDNPMPPPVYQKLLLKHGHVQPLVQVNLDPKKEASVVFSYDGIDRPDEVLEINMKQTTRQLKVWLSRRILIPPSKLRLVYHDDEAVTMIGPIAMRPDSKVLYTYRIKDGDKIVVIIKQ